jgi:ribose/xylose/arabinose/galactoside ABC-type transport system permease subunit
MNTSAKYEAFLAPSKTQGERKAWIASLVRRVFLPASPFILAAGFALYVPTIISPENILNIVQQTSFVFVLTCAQTIVLLTRGLDLSLGPSVSLVSVASTMAMIHVLGPPGFGGAIATLVGAAVGISVGLIVGIFNGFAVAWLRVNPFVATLASMNICLGISTSLSDGHPVFGIPQEFSTVGYRSHVLGVPIPIVYAAAVGLLLHFVLQHTTVGRSFYILGSNPRAAVVAGWPRRRLLAVAYILCGLLTAAGALMLTARTGSGEPNLGGGMSLQTIAAAVIGGVSLSGGRGGLGSAIIGSLLTTVLSNGMNLAAIDGYTQMVAMGAIIVTAVALDRLGRINT